VSNLSELALALHAAPSVDGLLTAANRDLVASVRDAELALVRYDPRKELLTQRALVKGERVEWQPLAVALDHFPRPVRAHFEHGNRLTDLGATSGEYLKLLGWTPDATPARLWVRALRIDGELAAVLAIHEPRRLFGGASVDDFEPASAMFELAFARLALAEARTEAVRALEKVTATIHEKYEHLIRELRGEVETLRDAMATQHVVPASQAKDLESHVQRLKREATDSSRRLQAVEQQVSDAVVRLESAHVELHRQSARIQTLEAAIRESRAALQEAGRGANVTEAIQRALASLERDA
jgi:hypothetical protein